MKKIGIITSTPSFINNYGAVLQAFALQTQLRNMGMDPYIIKYADDNEYVRGKAGFFERMKGTILNPRYTTRYKLRLITNKLFHRSVYPLFESFQDKHLTFYNNKYLNYDGLKTIGTEFDSFIVGSDQVWNPNVHNGINDPGYFLQFVPEGIKRIAYAPSMGINVLPDECKKNLGEYLESFDSLSIREESGRCLIKEICGIDVQVVVDPTLLLLKSDYETIKDCSRCPQKPYILYYKFGKLDTVEKLVARLSNETGYEVVCVPAGLDTRFKPDYQIGPSQFIGLISNAQAICTDSFHAAVFAIIYEKPLLAFCREDSKSKINMNSRIEGLLNSLDLTSAWFGMGENGDNIHFPVHDYCKTRLILAKKRDEGITYLRNAIGNNE